MHAHSHEHAHTHEGASEATRKILVEEDILARNNAYAARNREAFSRSATLALNLVSSPGSGKTTLLTRTLSALKADVPLAVIEGDQESELDAERIRAEAVPALQINTGKGCHLDAHMIGHALERLRPPEAGILFIENVGNLVCPAAFDLGESAKILILSVTEGEDKPLKYPDMFHAARLLIINKTDLLPHVRFSVETATDYARRIHPQMEVVTLSASTGEGFDVWLAWLTARLTEIKNARALELEAELARLKA
jgi:hydrogenase nickel incorporation protein HypB